MKKKENKTSDNILICLDGKIKNKKNILSAFSAYLLFFICNSCKYF